MRSVTITLTGEEAQYLYDEVAMGAAQPLSRYLNRYERRMVRMCRRVIGQLKQQGIAGVLARSWNERAEERDAANA